MKVSVQEYLWNTAKYPAKPICVVFGEDSFLRSDAVRHIRNQVLAGEDAEFALCPFEGDAATFKEVLAALQTIAMFGGGQRVVRVDDADTFVSKNREELEKYVANPSSQSVLILQVKSFPATTKLYKKLIDSGLLIEAHTLSEKEMPQWVEQWSKLRHKTTCVRAAAEMIVDRIGVEHGLLDQELGKLALMVTDPQKGITVELVEQAVGSLRVREVWDMLELALDGKTAAAVRQLNALMSAGETADGIWGQIASTLRKLAVATKIILDAEGRNSKMPLRSALEKAGVKPGFRDSYIAKMERHLKFLGRHRGARLSEWSLKFDLALKGDSKGNAQYKRLLLEAFLVKLSAATLREWT